MEAHSLGLKLHIHSLPKGAKKYPQMHCLKTGSSFSQRINLDTSSQQFVCTKDCNWPLCKMADIKLHAQIEITLVPCPSTLPLSLIYTSTENRKQNAEQCLGSGNAQI